MFYFNYSLINQGAKKLFHQCFHTKQRFFLFFLSFYCFHCNIQLSCALRNLIWRRSGHYTGHYWYCNHIPHHSHCQHSHCYYLILEEWILIFSKELSVPCRCLNEKTPASIFFSISSIVLLISITFPFSVLCMP